MKAGEFLMYQGIQTTTLTHLDRKEPRGTIKKSVHRRLGNPKMVIVYAFLFFTLKTAAEQIAMVILRHQ